LRYLRKYARQTQTRLIIGLLMLAFSLGLSLIWFLYGQDAALLGLVCLAGILIPLLLIVIILNIIERITTK